MKTLFVTLTLLLSMNLVGGADDDSDERVMMVGAGSFSCGKWLATKSDRITRRVYSQWIFGFVSGVNYTASSKSQAIISDLAGPVAFIDHYCENNPLHPLISAGAALVEEAGGPKTKHDWKR